MYSTFQYTTKPDMAAKLDEQNCNIIISQQLLQLETRFWYLYPCLSPKAIYLTHFHSYDTLFATTKFSLAATHEKINYKIIISQ